MQKVKIILTDINKALSTIIKLETQTATTNETTTKWYTNLANSVKHFLLWGLGLSSATLLDSFYGIIKTQIINSDTNNKHNTKLHSNYENHLLNTAFNTTNTSHTNIDFLNALKILVSLPNLLLAVIGQFVFMVKMKIADWCWTIFENSYLYKSINKGWNCVTNYCSSNNNKAKNQGQLQQEIDKIEAHNTQNFKIFEKKWTIITKNWNT